MTEELKEFLNIRYTKLYFTLEFTEDTELVRDKASALRGGMGEMMLRTHCVADRQCKSCGFERDCMVQRILYAQPDDCPSFMKTGASLGYNLECRDREREYRAGDRLEFNLTLFGANIVHLVQYISAFTMLGQVGLGANNSKFRVVEVRNLFHEPIMAPGFYDIRQYRWQTIEEYVAYRLEELTKKDGTSWVLKFTTPAELTYQGQNMEMFSEEAVAGSILRRLYMLDCFEGMSADRKYQPETSFPVFKHTSAKQITVTRHSNRKGQLVRMHGIRGFAKFDEVSEEWLCLILAAEILRIGKSTSFGFGGLKLDKV